MTAADAEAFARAAREEAGKAKKAGNGHDQEAGSESREWSEPQDLQEATHEPEPFPVDALPAEAEAAVVEYQAYGQQPLPMVASSALGAMSLAVQGLVDVQREAALNGPVSLAIVVIADSGERKTACDRTFARAAEDWAREEAKRLAPEIRKAREAREGHEAEKAGILTAIRELSARHGKQQPGDPKSGEVDLDKLKDRLKGLAAKLPPLPPIPAPMMENGTVEGVAGVLRNSWPSVAWSSNEGGTVTGGHGFKDDALMRTLAFLNQRWDGTVFDRARAAEDYSRTYGRRLTVSLMLQPAAFDAFRQAGNGMARGLGLLARCLVSWPPSTMGTRFRDPNEPERSMPALDRFRARAEALHRLPLPMPFDMTTLEVKPDEKGNPPADQLELSPAKLKLDPDARRLWLEHLNETERELAAKSAEHACRLAAIFHVWQHGRSGSIDADDMVRGIRMARWFLLEARRILDGRSENAVAADAELLARWVKTWTDEKEKQGEQEKREKWPTLKEAAQHAPYRLRDKARREPALALLIERHWLRQEKRDGKTTLVLNPKLPWEA
jgi:putative DNA primase/helicase